MVVCCKARMATSRKAPFHVLFIFVLVSKFYHLEAASLISNATRCMQREREALVKIKQSLIDSYGRLSSWVGNDCCNWTGVSCDNQTGHVFQLDLGTKYNCSSAVQQSPDSPYWLCKLGGTLSPSLLNLTSLEHLDLSYNNFLGIPIPNFLGSVKSLKYLNFYFANFSGMVPPHLGNLSNLFYLDLNVDTFPADGLWVSDLNWLSGLSSMQYLGLSGVNLSLATTNWLQAVNMIPSLLQLQVSGCQLYDLPQSLPFVNFTSLQAIDLSHNTFNTSIPHWLFNLSSLEQLKLVDSMLTGSVPKSWSGKLCKLRILDLSFNHIQGEIVDFMDALSGCSNRSLEKLDLSSNKLTGNLPDSLWLHTYLTWLKLPDNKLKGSLSDSLGSLGNLEQLDLSHNILSGQLPKSIWNLSRLEQLDLSFNMLSGTISDGVGQLTSLSRLNLYGNLVLEGVITEHNLQNLTNLYDLSISSVNKSLSFSLRQDWIPPFSLSFIAISDCQLGPDFPAWLQTQKSIIQVTLYDVGISDTIPEWLWSISPWTYWWDLSHNQLRGKLPTSISFPFDFGAWVDLGFNNLEGSIPLWRNVTNLSLRNNLFSGPIPSNIGHEMPLLENLDLSGNLLSGSIPKSMNNLRNLSFLDLSSNNLSGPIPSQWQGLQYLTTVDLSKNNLSGNIPNAFCSLPMLDWLQLGNNNLSGDISTFLSQCKVLYALDLGYNQFSGSIPESIVRYRTYVYLLNLRANKLTGTIPQQICSLPNLHILDLGLNNLSGTIPSCLDSLLRLKYPARILPVLIPPSTRDSSFFQHTELVIKGRISAFTKIISLVNTIDLSVNNLSGEIPGAITNLSTLGFLNLSWNQLTGHIPEKTGSLQQLEVLDLSHNHLSGPIPPSISSMSLLNYLNLSYNNLSGPIPSSNQLQTIVDPSIYEGNPGLCGPPLSTNCSTSSNGDKFYINKDDEDEDGFEKLGIYLSAALGFVVGFWAIFGTLVIKKSVRRAYFGFLDRIKDKLYVLIAAKLACLQRKMEAE